MPVLVLLAETEGRTSNVTVKLMKKDHVRIRAAKPGLPLDFEDVYYIGVEDEPSEVLLQLRMYLVGADDTIAVFKRLR